MDKKLIFSSSCLIELLRSLFRFTDFLSEEANQLQKKVIGQSAKLKTFSYRHPTRLRILFASSETVESKILEALLKDKKHFVDLAKDKESLLSFLIKRKAYDVVIVSDSFKQIGSSFFVLYFRQDSNRYYPKLIYLGSGFFIQGFDEYLAFPFYGDIF